MTPHSYSSWLFTSFFYPSSTSLHTITLSKYSSYIWCQLPIDYIQFTLFVPAIIDYYQLIYRFRLICLSHLVCSCYLVCSSRLQPSQPSSSSSDHQVSSLPSTSQFRVFLLANCMQLNPLMFIMYQPLPTLMPMTLCAFAFARLRFLLTISSHQVHFLPSTSWFWVCNDCLYSYWLTDCIQVFCPVTFNHSFIKIYLPLPLYLLTFIQVYRMLNWLHINVYHLHHYWYHCTHPFIIINRFYYNV